jgi:hypothetical protein
MNPKLRSFLRTLLFTVVPVVVVFLTDPVWLTEMGVPTEYVALFAALVGALARAFMPNVVATRPEA